MTAFPQSSGIFSVSQIRLHNLWITSIPISPVAFISSAEIPSKPAALPSLRCFKAVATSSFNMSGSVSSLWVLGIVWIMLVSDGPGILYNSEETSANFSCNYSHTPPYYYTACIMGGMMQTWKLCPRMKDTGPSKGRTHNLPTILSICIYYVFHKYVRNVIIRAKSKFALLRNKTAIYLSSISSLSIIAWIHFWTGAMSQQMAKCELQFIWCCKWPIATSILLRYATAQLILWCTTSPWKLLYK